MAGKVMRMSEEVSVTEKEEEKLQPKRFDNIQRKEFDVEIEKDLNGSDSESALPINRKATSPYNSDVIQQSGRGPPVNHLSFIHQLKSSKGTGIPLPGDTRRSMETHFNADFSGIRIHANTTSETLSRYIHAQAFTHGTDIYFNTGKFAPQTDGGAFLLAHELTHVMQQSGNKLTRKQHSHPVTDVSTPVPKASPVSALNVFTAAPTEAPVSKTIVNKPVPSATVIPAGDDTKRARTAVPKEGQEITPPAVKEKSKAVGDKTAPAVDIPKAPKTPGKDPAFQAAKRQVGAEAVRQKKHDPASQKRTDTEKASAINEDEQRDQSAREKSTGEMEKVGAEQKAEGRQFSAEQFKEDLLAKINQKQPESESEAKAFAQKPPLEHFEEDFSGKVATEQGKVTGPLEKQAAAPPSGGVVEKPVASLPKPVHSPYPRPVDPKLAIPKARTDQEISLQHESDRLDSTMEENKLSDEQLAESREPSFIDTLKAKQDAKQKIAEAPGVYRQREEALLGEAEAQTGKSLVTELNGMAKTNHKIGGKVFGGQEKTETETEKRQREIKEKIDGIYSRTVTAVKCILECMASKVKEDFANSLKDQTNIFNENVRRRISDYYGDWRIDDKLFGPADVVVLPDGSTRSMTFEEALGRKEVKSINPDVYRIFVDEKNKFLSEMNTRLDAIAQDVQDGLTAAHNRIQLGRMEIALYKLTLKGEELVYAGQLEQEVQMKFESLEESINDTREDLLQTMADQYKENVNQLEKTFNEINDELKKSWIDRAIDFIKTVGKTIFQLAELLLSILVRVAYLVWDIIKHPIRFFETLVSGLMQGIGSFIENIGTHMQEAFWTWITGATPGKNIRLSASSGVESLFDLVMQVLSLGPVELKAIAEKVLGKEFMQLLDKAIELGDKAMEPAIILLTKGPLAFWEYIKETLSEIIQSSFDRIRESVFNAFIEKALKYIAGFFIPGGGFVKIVKAIFKAFQFVAENLENIRQFFDSVFDSMEAAVAGHTEGVASKIIQGLKMGIVLALDFLAKLLGLDKIVDSVQKIIQSLRRPIVNAIEWILKKVKPFTMRLVALYKRGEAWAKEKINQAKATGKKVVSTVAGWLGLKKKFNTPDGESHQVYFKGNERNAQLMVASKNPKTITALLTAVEGVINQPANTGHRNTFNTAKTINIKVNDLIQNLNKDTSANKQQDYESLNAQLEKIKDLLPPLMALIGSKEPPPLVKPNFVNGVKATSFNVYFLKSGRLSGGSPANQHSGNLAGWAKIQAHGLSEGAAWVKMHLLTEQLGGPAVDANLTPARGPETNIRFRDSVEHPAKKSVDAGKVIWYSVTISYHGGANNDYINSIKIEWGPYAFNEASGQWEKKARGHVVDGPGGKPVGGIDTQNVSPPAFTGGPELLNINSGTGRVRIAAISSTFDRAFAEFILRVIVGLPNGFRNTVHMRNQLEIAYENSRMEIPNFRRKLTTLVNAHDTNYWFGPKD